MRQVRSSQQGFTLIELIAVIVILGILAATAIPRYIDLQRDAQRKAALTAIAEAQSRLNLAFSQFMLAGGDCTKLTGFSFQPYQKPTKSVTELTIGDESASHVTVGGWQLDPTALTVTAALSFLEITAFAAPGETELTNVSPADAPAEDASLFRIHFPQCTDAAPADGS